MNCVMSELERELRNKNSQISEICWMFYSRRMFACIQFQGKESDSFWLSSQYQSVQMKRAILIRIFI